MSDTTQNGAMEFRPSLAYRIWQALGFRYSAYIMPPDDFEAVYSTHHVICYWSWGDRLRIVLSGKTDVALRVETEVAEKIKRTTSCAVVLAPGARRKAVTQKPHPA